MKKYKLFILMAIFTMLSMVGEVKAASGPLTFNNYDMICTPRSIEAGGKSTCYLFAKISGGDTKLNGFVSVVYTNDNLKLDGVRAEASEVAYAKVVEPGKTASESGVTGNNYVLGDKGTDGTGKPSEFKCTLSWMDISKTRLRAAGASNAQVITEANKNDSACTIYYSASDLPVFDAGTLKTAGKHTDAFKDTTNRDEFAILGVYEVSLDPNMPQGANRCGDICVQVWTVPNGIYYSQALDCGVGGTECGNQHTTTTDDNVPVCTEIHIKASGSTETGAFASYTILAAAAFIAISAVAIAKKNNKLYKI